MIVEFFWLIALAAMLLAVTFNWRVTP